MTIKKAIAALIEPYSLTDNAIETAALSAFNRFMDFPNVDMESEYVAECEKSCGYAAMLLLSQLLPLTNENIGGISQTYNVAALKAQIKGIARRIGVSADLVLDDVESKVTYCPAW